MVRMFIIEKRVNETYSLPAKEIKLSQIKSIKSELAIRILKLISDKVMYPKEIAKKLKENEQKIYYHVRNMEKDRIIRVVKRETIQGAVANFYGLVEPAFVLRFKELKATQKITATKQETNEFLEPFIKEGQLNAMIIVGSPDPHGPEKARSRDGYYGMDLALFLGTFLNYVPNLNVKLDTETRSEDLNNNLILIGGPIVNKVTEKVNDKLPIRFDKGNIYSSVSKQKYMSDEIGIIVKARNPFNKEKYVLLVAGKRYSGTKAAIIAFLKKFNEIVLGNKKNNKINAKVVEGIDLDSDGIVDDIEIRE